jgi:hypothetical protein
VAPQAPALLVDHEHRLHQQRQYYQCHPLDPALRSDLEDPPGLSLRSDQLDQSALAFLDDLLNQLVQ